MEDIKLQPNEPVGTPEEAVPATKTATISKKQLEKDNAVLEEENAQMVKTINEMNTYIDKLYANSNVLVNKVEGTKSQLNQLRLLTGMLGNTLTLVNERISAIEAFLTAKGE